MPQKPVPSKCGTPYCRAFHMTIWEYRRLSGEKWSQSFCVRLGQRAKKIYREIYATKKLQKKRPSVGHRNPVTKFPCGIIEQAYKALIAEGVQITDPGKWADPDSSWPIMNKGTQPLKPLPQ